MKIVFKTKGLINLTSLTTFGINAKPTTKNPIGYFGTGLKYAIAILCRNPEDKVTLYRGKVAYTITSKKRSFRGRGFDFVTMESKHDSIELPFTTELGKGWEMWQAFRELESNTRDENGVTYATENPVKGEAGHTKIVVENDEFTQSYVDRDSIFLDTEQLTIIKEGYPVDVFDQPSSYLYYRGMRVMKLKHPSTFTYNIQANCTLTEDRTLAYSWDADYWVRYLVMNNKDESFIKRILDETKSTYENSLDWATMEIEPTKEFLKVLVSYVRAGKKLAYGYSGYYDKKFGDTNPEREVKLRRDSWTRILEILDVIDIDQVVKDIGWKVYDEDPHVDSYNALRDKLRKITEVVEEEAA